MKFLAALLLLAATLTAQDVPRFEKRDGRFALMVDGKPFLMLGAQLNNSSAWPAAMPNAWDKLEAFHVNTVEAPVYWEQMEPSPGTFDFTSVDALLAGAREHHLHLVLLWFGTWKNGQNHYIPEWMKSDLKTYPREISAYGKVLDVMSPHSSANLEADKRAFTALMRHLKQADGSRHTVLMMQVENESGSVGSVRDFTPAAQREFEQPLPADLTHTLHLPSGTWTKVFGAEADERFAAYATAHYIGEVARAGKAEYALPMYCNVWLAYPVHALENRDRPNPGQDYPSGGPQQANIAIWKAAAPAIDALAPDFYADDPKLYRNVLSTYARPDNPLFIPEIRANQDFGRFLFYALGSGAVGFAPFGIDHGGAVGGPPPASSARPLNPADNFALLAPIADQVAQSNFQGKLQTAVEERGSERQTVHFPTADTILSFGFPQADGANPPGTPDRQGRALIAQLGPLDFLVTGFDASITFRTSANDPKNQLEILRAEEGTFVNGVWTPTRILNGDETDRGLNFHGIQPVVRIRLHKIPLYDDRVRTQP